MRKRAVDHLWGDPLAQKPKGVLRVSALRKLPPEQQAAALEAARQAQRRMPVPTAQASRVIRPSGPLDNGGRLPGPGG